jgi:hypothetical protein
MFAQQRYYHALSPARKPPQLPTAYADLDLIYQRNGKKHRKTQWKQQSINRHVHGPTLLVASRYKSWARNSSLPCPKQNFGETMKLAYSLYPWLRKLVMICELCKSNIATIYLTKCVDDTLVKLRICKSCAQNTTLVDAVGFEALGEFPESKDTE